MAWLLGVDVWTVCWPAAPRTSGLAAIVMAADEFGQLTCRIQQGLKLHSYFVHIIGAIMCERQLIGDVPFMCWCMCT